MGAPVTRTFPDSQTCIVCAEVKPIAAFLRENAPCRPPRKRCDTCNDAILASGKSRAPKSDEELQAAMHRKWRDGALTGWERYWANVQKRHGGCWLWTGCTHVQGYGTICIDGYNWRTHRLAYSLAHGLLTNPRTMVCHRCDEPACVNPDHLFLGTHRDNMRDMVRKARRAGSRNSAAVLTEEIVLELRQSDLPNSVWAKRLGMHPNSIYKARAGIKWGHLPGAWKNGKRPPCHTGSDT